MSPNPVLFYNTALYIKHANWLFSVMVCLRAGDISYDNLLITGRNEVVAKVMFLHVSVILYTGGGLRRTPPDQADPPGPRRTPLGPRRTPRDQGEPPQNKENPPGTKKNPPPGTKENPPGPGRPPPGKRTAAYGQWAAGTHPTGMHSCF